MRREIPTFSKILTEINGDSTLSHFTSLSLRKLLKGLNFKYNKKK